MVRRTRHSDTEDDVQSSSLAPLASVSDLMIALLAFFVATTAISIAKLQETQFRLAETQRKQVLPQPDTVSKAIDRPELVWDITLKEFERRQLAIRVHSAWGKAFHSIPGAVEPSDSTIIIQLPGLTASSDATSIDRSLAGAKKAIVSGLGTKWQDYDAGAGCRLEVDSTVILSVGVRNQSDWIWFKGAREALDRFAWERFHAHVEGASELSRGGARLLVNFRLQNELRKRLETRFQLGPGADVPEKKLWCN